jgi:hypothetical protein
MNGIHFCETCHNLTGLYVRESDNELVNYCKHCSTSRICDTQERCIYKLDMKPTDRSLSLNKNKYITHDPTLPQIVGNPNITCTNGECPSVTDDLESSVSYIKYDIENMKYMYICTHCGQKWKT